MIALSTLQAVLIAAPLIAFLVTAWLYLEAMSALRAVRWGNRMLSRALAQADVDAQARGYK